MRAVAYVRAMQTGETPAAAVQRREVEAWARHARTKIARWYVDEAGPCPIDERPALVSALSSLGPDCRVVCISRPEVVDDAPWARTVVEHLAVHAGGSVIYAGGFHGSPSPTDLDRALNVHERLLLRVQASRAAQLLPHESPWGRVPWGYRLAADGVNLEPNSAEQAVTSIVRHMRLTGFRLREIRDELKQLGVVGRTGNPLSITRIFELLNDGQGSRRDVLARKATVDRDAPPASVVRPSSRPESVQRRAAASQQASTVSGRRRTSRR